VSVTGVRTGPSQPSEHAPVGVVGIFDVGSKQGTHFCADPHELSGRRGCAATDGKQVERHRPSAPAIDVHEAGLSLFAEAMMKSGVQ
jgi:hypothetical protein